MTDLGARQPCQCRVWAAGAVESFGTKYKQHLACSNRKQLLPQVTRYIQHMGIRETILVLNAMLR
jgi:hypothetical protein